MITCCIQYRIDPLRLAEFEDYASRWRPIIERCGGTLVDYYLPKEGATDFALALINFDSLASYEAYRARLAADPQAQRNIADVSTSRAIISESRSFLRPAG
ncbi:MAG: NIPSNAP family protein [Candidatus Dormibacteria bacterium]